MIPADQRLHHGHHGGADRAEAGESSNAGGSAEKGNK